ncbi:hypothetical protein K470DRAFT_267394 [Piedraia hortae CBS 480.64]|uniref:Uncharacterized protein n=1 Tax=Piedraia hortae CBS 480.64 TaxID=1314780 RepID=A0A6A7CC30_9PEZI|nr:hypothetical protein K470DRAFT_267394 [Piedraia hortae CBS 480.64]
MPDNKHSVVATTAVNSQYEHWRDDASLLKAAPAPVPGWDTHNGLRAFKYYPAKAKTDDTSTVASVTTKAATVKADPPAAPINPQDMVMPYACNPMMSMNCMPPMYYPACPMPVGFYPYPHVQVPEPAKPFVTYVPPKPNKWQGRTKRQVAKDNMEIATREGAYDKRKIIPAGVPDDQIMWCEELDGSHTIRTFGDLKGMKGTWMKDPRFNDCYFFVRE